mmetsp:Transcript_26374/g.55813  ORF Transcript_26374/g.55813 Transcript_26374/m.55813 type:complete len:135 (-) Transcript_26374:44-448(-)
MLFLRASPGQPPAKVLLERKTQEEMAKAKEKVKERLDEREKTKTEKKNEASDPTEDVMTEGKEAETEAEAEAATIGDDDDDDDDRVTRLASTMNPCTSQVLKEEVTVAASLRASFLGSLISQVVFLLRPIGTQL